MATCPNRGNRDPRRIQSNGEPPAWAEHALAHTHECDADCAPFLRADGTCTVCGVAHGEPCDACGGRGFHVAGCAA